MGGADSKEASTDELMAGLFDSAQQRAVYRNFQALAGRDTTDTADGTMFGARDWREVHAGMQPALAAALYRGMAGDAQQLTLDLVVRALARHRTAEGRAELAFDCLGDDKHDLTFADGARPARLVALARAASEWLTLIEWPASLYSPRSSSFDEAIEDAPEDRTAFVEAAGSAGATAATALIATALGAAWTKDHRKSAPPPSLDAASALLDDGAVRAPSSYGHRLLQPAHVHSCSNEREPPHIGARAQRRASARVPPGVAAHLRVGARRHFVRALCGHGRRARAVHRRHP